MDTKISSESALAILVPEAEPLVEPFRLEHDPSAAAGIPAHITVLYPFKPPEEITPETIQTLENLFANSTGVDFCFSEWRRLARVLYLAPVPEGPFKEMIEVVSERFPETPPYAGQFADIIPHLTVAQNDDPHRLQEIADEFERAATEALPIHARAQEVVLLDNVTGRWRIRNRFTLSKSQIDLPAPFGSPSIK